jgi:hypothetical protein
MRKLKPEFEIFWKELQAIRYGFFRPDRNFIGYVRTLSSLCDEHHTDDLFLAIYKETGWNF